MSDSFDPMQSMEWPKGPRPKFRFRFGMRTILWAVALAAMMFALFLPMQRSSPEPSFRSQCRNNLRQIALALRSYEETYGSLPPAYIAAEDGTPMHSWRVLILPFLDQKDLYDRYRFDEPWNGPNNSKLAQHIPSVYRCPSFEYGRWGVPNDSAESKTLTPYVVLAGDKTPFPGPQATKTEDIRDGLSHTLLVVELDSTSGVPWMAPQDTDTDGFCRILNLENPRTKQHPGGLHVAFADAVVRFLKNSLDPNFVQKIATANGGEPFQWKNAPW